MRVMRVVCIQNYNLEVEYITISPMKFKVDKKKEVEYKISLHQKSLSFVLHYGF